MTFYNFSMNFTHAHMRPMAHLEPFQAKLLATWQQHKDGRHTSPLHTVGTSLFPHESRSGHRCRGGISQSSQLQLMGVLQMQRQSHATRACLAPGASTKENFLEKPDGPLGHHKPSLGHRKPSHEEVLEAWQVTVLNYRD